MRRLYPFIMGGGFLYWLFSDVTGIGWYLDTGNKETDLKIGWTMFGGMVLVIAALTRMVLAGHKEVEEEEANQAEYEEEEVYQEPVKITWWNDYYTDEAPKKSWLNDNWED